MDRRMKGWKLALDKLSEEERVKLLCSDNCGGVNILGKEYVPTSDCILSRASLSKDFIVLMEKNYEKIKKNENANGE